MKRSRGPILSSVGGSILAALLGVALAQIGLSAIRSCGGTPSQSAVVAPAPQLPRFVPQNYGQELMVVAKAQLGSIGMVRKIPLPGVLEAIGQVTFDDRLVSTIVSRVAGRIEELRKSQWDSVRRGEPVVSLYSPDFMTAEAEYLEATYGTTHNLSTRPDDLAFPTATFGMTANLRDAVLRKLELLGFSPSDISSIRTPSASVWMRAPISGIIVSRNAVRGQQVSPGDQLFSLATLERVWITADIYEDDFSRVNLGQNLEVVTAAYPAEVFKATVQKISPSFDPNTHTVQLRCEIKNPGSRLKPQMLARVRIATSSGSALVIPQSALVFDENAYYVFILVAEDTVERRRVEIADWNERGYARVTSGINPGERFLTTQSLRMNSLWHMAHGETS